MHLCSSRVGHSKFKIETDRTFLLTSLESVENGEEQSIVSFVFKMLALVFVLTLIPERLDLTCFSGGALTLSSLAGSLKCRIPKMINAVY